MTISSRTGTQMGTEGMGIDGILRFPWLPGKWAAGWTRDSIPITKDWMVSSSVLQTSVSVPSGPLLPPRGRHRCPWCRMEDDAVAGLHHRAEQALGHRENHTAIVDTPILLLKGPWLQIILFPTSQEQNPSLKQTLSLPNRKGKQ